MRGLASLLLALLLAAPAFAQPAAPVFRADGPDAADYGKGQDYPRGTRDTFFRVPHLVHGLSHLDELLPARPVAAPPAAAPLRYAARAPAIAYRFNGARKTLKDYLDSNPVTGLLILRGDEIQAEQYQYGRTDRQRFTSFSMAKTITAMLFGIALAEGRIRSIDDPAAAYLPALAGTEYGATPLRHLLTMSSGVEFREEYDGADDVSKLWRASTAQLGPGGAAAVTPFNKRIRPAGETFYYASAETQVLGLVLTAAIGMPLADYLSDRIWRPMGAEAGASWIVDLAGQESTYCCFNAVLRDYGRLGLLLARDGRGPDGRQLIPADWVKAATTVRPEDAHLAPRKATRYYGYGYQTWIFPGPRRMFAFQGVRGQVIFVDPASQTVLAHTAVRRQSRDPGGSETVSLWFGILESLGIDPQRPG